MSFFDRQQNNPKWDFEDRVPADRYKLQAPFIFKDVVIFQIGISKDKAYLFNTWIARGTVTLTGVFFPNFSEPMGL